MRKMLVILSFLGLSSMGARAADQPSTSFPYTPGLDVNAMDKTANPCVDFFQYTCGGWMKNNPIPGDQPRWSVYGKLTQDNQRYLWGILMVWQKICRDETAISKKSAIILPLAWTRVRLRRSA